MAEEIFSTVIFKKKTFGNLLEEIHTNVKNSIESNKNQVDQLVDMVEQLGDAIQLTDKIQGYIKLSNESNEHLIKMAGIIQKSLDKGNKKVDEDQGSLTEEEKQELLEMHEMLKLESPQKVLDKIKAK